MTCISLFDILFLFHTQLNGGVKHTELEFHAISFEIFVLAVL